MKSQLVPPQNNDTKAIAETVAKSLSATPLKQMQARTGNTLQAMADNSTQVKQMKVLQQMADSAVQPVVQLTGGGGKKWDDDVNMMGKVLNIHNDNSKNEKEILLEEKRLRLSFKRMHDLPAIINKTKQDADYLRNIKKNLNIEIGGRLVPSNTFTVFFLLDNYITENRTQAGHAESLHTYYSTIYTEGCLDDSSRQLWDTYYRLFTELIARNGEMEQTMSKVDSIIEEVKDELLKEEEIKEKEAETPPSTPVLSEQILPAPKTPTPPPELRPQVFKNGQLILMAVKANNLRFEEALELAKIITDENPSFDKETVIATIIQRLPDNNTIFLNNRIIQIEGTGSRYAVHIPVYKVVKYFRTYRKEIEVGDNLSLRVGEGRTSGYAVHGQILYRNNGSEIQYWHAHDKGKIG
jgi:hypothetical protein